MKGQFLQSLLKRGLDVVAAGSGLCVLLPLLVAIAVAVWATMGRPVLFRQRRPGRGGRPFTMYKFRTMTDQRGPNGGSPSDERRITRLGRFLRSTSLDELPELYNVLRGDMSLVGPRPLLPEYLERYTPEQARRHGVRPGITGWAQIHGRNAISWEKRFALDVWYVDHWSLRLDLLILWLTAWKVIRREGISAPDHATMPEFVASPNGGRPVDRSAA